MEDLPIGSEIVLKVVESETEENRLAHRATLLRLAHRATLLRLAHRATLLRLIALEKIPLSCVLATVQ